MKTLVIHHSQYGSSKQYAQWICDAVGGDLCSLDEFRAGRAAAYDAIVYGGGLYASGIRGIKKFLKIWPALEGKKVVVFATGFSPYRQGLEEEIRQNNLPPHLKTVPLFYMRGAMDRKKLNFIHKKIIAMASKVKEEDGSGVSDGNWIDRDALTPLLTWLGEDK